MMLGIPRSFYYYYNGAKLKLFLKILNIDYIVSPETNEEIMALGDKYSSNDVCTSMKKYIGHIAYLYIKCDYILIPRINNYDCISYINAYKIIDNLYNDKIIYYDIDPLKEKIEQKSLIKVCKMFNHNIKMIKRAYKESTFINGKLNEFYYKDNLDYLNIRKNKILIIGQPYNVNDKYFIKNIINKLTGNDCAIIYSYLLKLEEISKIIEYNLVDGIIYIDSKLCKNNKDEYSYLDIPYINICIDELNDNNFDCDKLDIFINKIRCKPGKDNY